MRVYHLCPASLDRYGKHLERGFNELNVFVSRNKEDAASCTVTLAQLHAADHEVPVCHYENFVGPTIVLIHRPEEFLLRCPTPQQRDIYLRGARAIVLLGQCMVDTYMKLYPLLMVKSIPHGFFDTDSHLVDEEKDEEDPIRVVGSVTTWGEMRQPLDALQLIRALPRGREKEGEKKIRLVGLLAGSMEGGVVELLQEHAKDVKIVSHEDFGVSESDFSHLSESDLRRRLRGALWALQRAEPTNVALCCVDGPPFFFKALSLLCLDVNIQLYREHHDDRDGHCKVEYSGTAHTTSTAVLCMWQSPSAKDLQRDEGLQMVLVEGPHCKRQYFVQQQNYPYDPVVVLGQWKKAAISVAQVLWTKGKLKEMIINNEKAASKWPMSQVAKHYVELFEKIK